ncbi:MAG TPA: DUF1549 and DUF1553 domain-containing protein [Bryobacteraceae bacterium]|jgi:hypothetical protein|nr:DUF1549 and DUF1553 domain-containing protein [Bryobacteraceae bacterium]
MRLPLILLLTAASAWPAGGDLTLRTWPAQASLRGSRATQQFIATATEPDGTERDVTAQVEWRLSNPAKAKLISAGRLAPLEDGVVTLTAALSGKRAQSTVRIEQASAADPVSFVREISGILTKQGCNVAVCHGGVKGQGGFKLSANALYPADDYDWITKGGGYQVLTADVKGERIPRIDAAAPEKSLLLLKPTMAVPHGGGKRLEADSDDYKMIVGWIRNGAPYRSKGDTAEARVKRLELYPLTAIVPAGAEQRLLVTAHFTDGHAEDYTHQAMYTVNDGEIAAVSSGGLVSAKRRGETSILVRAAGLVASAGVGVIGPPVRNYPKVPRANFIDEHVFGKLRKFQIVPSELAGDSEFLRRVCLDLTGTLPPPDRVREFLADKDPKKREKLIDTLIGSPEFVDYWTFRFADIFRVSIFSNGLSPKWSEEYWEWIRANVESNRPYDEVARERISAEGYRPPTRHFLPYNQIGAPADTMAEEVRVFMGRRLDCAQCHNHPYENWSQDQFWGMAAFFSRLLRMGAVVIDHPVNMDLGTKDAGGSMVLLHPRTKVPVKPALLDSSPLAIAPDGNPRKELARWMTGHPYFAEAAVNRMWGQFFARGIVDPVDDFRSTNPPTHPELLAALATDFRSHGYDLRHLMKTIVSSRTYQLSYRPNDTNREDVTNYSRSLARGLDAEVMLDAVADVTGIPETFSTAVSGGTSVGQAPAGTRAIQLRDPDTFFSRFLELYGRSNRGAIPERNTKPNLGQALHVLAGSSYVDRLGASGGRLSRLLESGASDEKIFEEFYLAAFSRLPEAEEIQALKTLLARRSDREAGLREFVWALISSREFAENH